MDDAIGHFLEQIIRHNDRTTLVFLITITAIFFAVFLTAIAVMIVDTLPLLLSLFTAAVIALIIAPLISWKLVGQFIRLNQSEQEMRNLATYDSLTGLLTRQAFFHDAQSCLNVANRTQDPFVTMMLDLDHFKRINDTFGHHIGDRVLVRLGTFFKEHLKNSDIIGRIGGEEFAVILPNTYLEDAFELAQTIRSDLEKLTFTETGTPLSITISIGLTFHSGKNPAEINDILKEADTALYQAKRNGRNRVESYDPAWDQVPEQKRA